MGIVPFHHSSQLIMNQALEILVASANQGATRSLKSMVIRQIANLYVHGDLDTQDSDFMASEYKIILHQVQGVTTEEIIRLEDWQACSLQCSVCTKAIFDDKGCIIDRYEEPDNSYWVTPCSPETRSVELIHRFCYPAGRLQAVLGPDNRERQLMNQITEMMSTVKGPNGAEFEHNPEYNPNSDQTKDKWDMKDFRYHDGTLGAIDVARSLHIMGLKDLPTLLLQANVFLSHVQHKIPNATRLNHTLSYQTRVLRMVCHPLFCLLHILTSHIA